jgi:hypothetical protein
LELFVHSAVPGPRGSGLETGPFAKPVDGFVRPEKETPQLRFDHMKHLFCIKRSIGRTHCQSQ